MSAEIGRCTAGFATIDYRPFENSPREPVAEPDPQMAAGASRAEGIAMEKITKRPNGNAANAPLDPKASLATVNHGRTVSDSRQGELVFLQTSPADSVFYIQKGRIKIVVASRQGKEAVVAILGPGEFFGEGCLIGQPLRLSTARAMVASDARHEGGDGPYASTPSRRLASCSRLTC